MLDTERSWLKAASLLLAYTECSGFVLRRRYASRLSRRQQPIILLLALGILLSLMHATDCASDAEHIDPGPDKKDRRYCARMQDAEQIRVVADKVRARPPRPRTRTPQPPSRTHAGRRRRTPRASRAGAGG